MATALRVPISNWLLLSYAPDPAVPTDDFRLFCGDLGNDVTDEVLANAFRHMYPSFAKAKVSLSV